MGILLLNLCCSECMPTIGGTDSICRAGGGPSAVRGRLEEEFESSGGRRRFFTYEKGGTSAL